MERRHDDHQFEPSADEFKKLIWEGVTMTKLGSIF
jgi:hypothetical protein